MRFSIKRIILLFKNSISRKIAPSKIEKEFKVEQILKNYTYEEKFNLELLENEIEKWEHKPLISIVIPHYNCDSSFFSAAIKSVENQAYPFWELCICDDGSTDLSSVEFLRSIESEKIKVHLSDINKGISSATNTSLSFAKGEYVLFLDGDDKLTKDALYELVKRATQSGAEMLYSDEDLISKSGKYINPTFKPDWNPDLLLSYNYINHVVMLKKSFLEKVGRLRSKYDGAQDYDLYLRASEQANKVEHIAKVLYHWRQSKTSMAGCSENKEYVIEVGKKVLLDAIKRRQIDGDIISGEIPGQYRLVRELKSKPLVSIIIPFKDFPDLLRQCLSSIIEKSTYSNFEIIGISNSSEQVETYEVMKEWEKKDKRIKFYEYNTPFNYSQINNYGVSLSKGEHLLLLNNDTEVISPRWIEGLLEHSMRDDVGAVGAKLLYPDMTVQHGGVYVSERGIGFHAHLGLRHNSSGICGRLNAIQCVSAVTGACLMVKKEIFIKLRGLNEMKLKVAFNDVDFCLRLQERGLINIYTPCVELFHYESVSRGDDSIEIEKRSRALAEASYMNLRHEYNLKHDPYYNENLLPLPAK